MRRSAFLLAATLALVSCTDGEPRPKRAPDYDLDARSVCKDFVRERLVAPSTADFQNVFEFQVRKLSDLEFIVVGEVDAQNRLGARVRSTFKCQVRREANADSWTPVEVLVTER